MGSPEGDETMMDFNSSSSLSGRVTALVDAGMQDARARQSERQYLGASRLGVACERALQFSELSAWAARSTAVQGRPADDTDAAVEEAE